MWTTSVSYEQNGGHGKKAWTEGPVGGEGGGGERGAARGHDVNRGWLLRS